MPERLISYEQALEEARAHPEEVAKSWLLHDLKQSPEAQQALREMVFEKLGLLTAENGNSPRAILRALAALDGAR